MTSAPVLLAANSQANEVVLFLSPHHRRIEEAIPQASMSESSCISVIGYGVNRFPPSW